MNIGRKIVAWHKTGFVGAARAAGTEALRLWGLSGLARRYRAGRKGQGHQISLATLALW